MMLPGYTKAGPSPLPTSPKRNETPHIPAAAKHKAVDPAEKSGIPPDSLVANESGSDDDDHRQQIWMDAKMAVDLQAKERRHLKRDRQCELKSQNHVLRLEEKVKELEKWLEKSSRQPSSNAPDPLRGVKRNERWSIPTQWIAILKLLKPTATICMNIP
jgi:hypothetical protein